MANLIRLGARRCWANSLAATAAKGYRCVNTSSRVNDASSDGACGAEKKNWITYGFNNVDPFVDRITMHVTAFLTISLCLVSGFVYFLFVPDPRCAEWAQREAYLELRRRESLGLPPIDPYYVDPDTVRLPTDEELGDTPIIV